jgi:SAM-dependent methyltransferase
MPDPDPTAPGAARPAAGIHGPHPSRRPLRLRMRLRMPPWPLPALACWAGGWLCAALAQQAGAGPALAWLTGWLPGVAAARHEPLRWRRLWLLAGYPASSLLAAAPGLPAWAWAVAAGLLAVAYPRRAWRDAPLFPTPADALQGLRRQIPLPPDARVLDAGCGLGHGLRALRRQWPQARLDGLEWSWPLAVATRLRCRDAQVRRGDMWRADWSPYAMVYLFQRPETMPRAWAKACAEMAPGSWLLSLDFPVPGVMSQRLLQRPGRRPLWLYRIPSHAAQAATPAELARGALAPIRDRARSAAATPAAGAAVQFPLQPADKASDTPATRPGDRSTTSAPV